MNASEPSLHSPAQLPFLAHLLEVSGLRAAARDRVSLRLHAHDMDAEGRAVLAQGGVVLAVRPAAGFCAPLGVSLAGEDLDATDLPPGANSLGVPLRTLHSNDRYAGAGEDVVCDADGRGVWRYVSHGGGTVLLVGTELAADLLRFRQGDPAAAQCRPQETLWDVAGERPPYLFERQLAGLPRHAQRQADFWAVLAARLAGAWAGVELAPVLPGNAPGAVIITGDDDQAYLEKYAEQLALLGDAPVTYFLHPLTRHTRKTMREMFAGTRVELGIHPDALDAPQSYAQRLHEQCAWFRELTGDRPLSLRNHGFLNDGYWGHLGPWLAEDIRISTNLPGLDGRALNGSYLPGRVWKDGRLSSHWSVLTAIGDGVRYVDGGRPDADAARCVHELADAIRASGIPGLIVLNLHPQNVADTRAMHAAAREVIRSGFLPWTMSDCLSWFERYELAPPARPWQRAVRRLRSWCAPALAGKWS